MSGQSKRYKPDARIAGLLEQIWYDHYMKGKKLTAFQVLSIAQQQLDELKRKQPHLYSEELSLPKIRETQNILKEVRNKYQNLPDPVREYIDQTSQHWNLASLKDYSIPHEALPVVMKVSRLCRISEQPFTIRHALWCARLSTAITDIQHLAHWANVYAHRELKCLLTNQPLYTGDLDSVWSMSPWELATAYMIGDAAFLKWSYFVESYEHQELYPMPDYTSSGAIQVSMPYLHELTAKLEYHFLRGSESAIEKPQPIEQLDLSYTAERVYGMWLQHMSKGAKANDLSQSERMELLLRLREWVKNHKLVKEPDYKVDDTFGGLAGWLPLTAIMPIGEIVEEFDLAPVELLELVGYDRTQWESFSTYLRKTKRGVTNE